MRWTHKETFSDEKGQEYHFNTQCPTCKSKSIVSVKGPDLFKYNMGTSIQEAFPYLSRNKRERLMTGICCLNKENEEMIL